MPNGNPSLDFALPIENGRDRRSSRAESAVETAIFASPPSSCLSSGPWHAQAAGYLLDFVLDFANTTVTNEINSYNADDKYAAASLVLAFDPDGRCNEDGQGFETTGAKVILMPEGVRDPAYGRPSWPRIRWAQCKSRPRPAQSWATRWRGPTPARAPSPRSHRTTPHATIPRASISCGLPGASIGRAGASVGFT